MKYFVYILISKKDSKYYIGQTASIPKRLLEHNSGKVHSTKNRTPLEVVYSEELPCRIDAIRREKHFKSYKNTKDLLAHLLSNMHSSDLSPNIV